MSFTAYLCSAVISSYSMFARPVPLVVESLLPYHLLHLHQQIFRVATSAMIPFAFVVRLVFWIFTNVAVSVASRYCHLLQVLIISLALRKRYFQDRVAGRLRQGTRQVLILGAGYDALGTLFAEMYPTVLFVEVDQPRMSKFKKYIVEQLGKRRHNLMFLPVDLSTENLEEKLLKEVPQWDVNTKTVITAEGLFMYLTAESVRRCMCSIKAVTPSNTMVAFSYLQKQQLNKGSRSITDRFLWLPNLFSEPLKWVANNEEEVANVIEGGEFYAELAPHESNLFRKYLRDNQFGIEDHPFYHNFSGMAMSK